MNKKQLFLAGVLTSVLVTAQAYTNGSTSIEELPSDTLKRIAHATYGLIDDNANCSAIAISESQLVTAAHCLYPKFGGELTKTLTYVDHNNISKTVNVEKDVTITKAQNWDDSDAMIGIITDMALITIKNAQLKHINKEDRYTKADLNASLKTEGEDAWAVFKKPLPHIYGFGWGSQEKLHFGTSDLAGDHSTIFTYDENQVALGIFDTSSKIETEDMDSGGPIVLCHDKDNCKVLGILQRGETEPGQTSLGVVGLYNF